VKTNCLFCFSEYEYGDQKPDTSFICHRCITKLLDTSYEFKVRLYHKAIKLKSFGQAEAIRMLIGDIDGDGEQINVERFSDGRGSAETIWNEEGATIKTSDVKRASIYKNNKKSPDVRRERFNRMDARESV